MLWCLQDRRYQLGDTSQWMSIIKKISKKHNKIIPIFFETKDIESIYKNCLFIKILKNKPKTEPFLTNRLDDFFYMLKKNKSPYEGMSRKILDKKYQYSPYVEKQDIKIDFSDGIAIVHGCLNISTIYGINKDELKEIKKNFKKRIIKKTLNKKIRQSIINETYKNGFTPIILGNNADKTRFWDCINKNKALCFFDAGLNKTIGILSKCKAIICNDTGLAHIAAGLKMKGLVIFKKTPIEFGPKTEKIKIIKHSNNENTIREIRRFLKSIN